MNLSNITRTLIPALAALLLSTAVVYGDNSNSTSTAGAAASTPGYSILWRNKTSGANMTYGLSGNVISQTESVRGISDTHWQVKGNADFNGDGQSDILWRNAVTGQNGLYLMGGMNGSSVAQVVLIKTIADLNWQIVGVGDFNNDSRADIFWRNTSTGENYIFLMDGATITSINFVSTIADKNWKIAGVGDLNGDNKGDILWRNTSTGQNWIYLMDGAAISNSNPLFTVTNQHWQVAGIADFNNDTKADILWRNDRTGQNWLFQMNGVTIGASSEVRRVSNTRWKVAHVADFNNDGMADIFWRNNSTGQNWMFQMNGNEVSHSAKVNTLADLNWEVAPSPKPTKTASPPIPPDTPPTPQPSVPTVTLSATPDNVMSNGSTTLNWSSTHATNCKASGVWSGSKATTGSEKINALTIDSTFSLNCTGAGGTASATTTVTVTPEVPGNTAPTINGTPASSIQVGMAYSFTPTANDTDGDSLSFSISNAPDWAQFNTASGALTGSPQVGDVGTDSNIIISVSDGQESASLAAFVIQVLGDSGGDGGDTGGDDIADCDVTVSPGDSFATAFSQLSAGQMLCLNDGVYRQAMDVPSNKHVRAVHDGMAEIDGGSNLGHEWTGGLFQMLGDNSSARGLRVHHAGDKSDACTIKGTNNVMRVMSCSHGGGHKHKIPLSVGGSGHLIEDSWFFGEGRYVVKCGFSAGHTFRRNVARWDSTVPNFPGEPNAAFSMYACKDVTIENNISLDYGVPETPMKYGGDFYQPAHSNNGFTPNNNHWLGNIAINHASDTNNNKAMRFDPDMDTTTNVVKDFYVRDVGVGFVITPRMVDLQIENCTMINTPVGKTSTASSGVDIDCGGEADISKRYVDRVKTNQSLFPWPNESLIKRDMCAQQERQSDLCLTDETLSEYVLGTTPAPTPTTPTVSVSASPTSVVSNGSTTLNWSSNNANSCTASGAWSGSKATSGSETIDALTADSTFNLSCTGAGGTANTATIVTVTPEVPSNTAPTISGTPASSIQAGIAYSFIPTANDADSDSLSFSISNAPGWAQFNTTSGALTGTPQAGDVGTNSNIIITVSDGQESTSLPAFAIQVGNDGSCTATGISSATYDINWDSISDPGGNINGFRIYFSTTQNPVTKSNADNSFTISGTAATSTYSFRPGDYLIPACTNVSFAVASMQDSKESELSDTVNILIE